MPPIFKRGLRRGLTISTRASNHHGSGGECGVKPKEVTPSPDIAGAVASMTESELGGESEKLQSRSWLTGTAVRGGQAVWMFSLM